MKLSHNFGMGQWRAILSEMETQTLHRPEWTYIKVSSSASDHQLAINCSQYVTLSACWWQNWWHITWKWLQNDLWIPYEMSSLGNTPIWQSWL